MLSFGNKVIIIIIIIIIMKKKNNCNTILVYLRREYMWLWNTHFL